ncbi:IclR family transcriptional regulator [Novosphingobium rosa]|uniref:IclR family transcriptional regulator n=1 Tax=Novosphingobium rosa TaxID=76978 RepID=UPI000B3335A5|nr:IclR family transcriptional regulator [Novosphingobium rosa]
MSEQVLSSEERRQKYSVPALEKGLDIIERLAEEAVPVTQSQLARTLGRQPGELFRMLACLEGRNYVRRDPGTGGYMLTLKLFELSRIHSPYEALLTAARPYMRQLSDTVRESCHLSVLNRDHVLVLAQEESPKPFRLSAEVGSVHSPFRTTSGRLLLASLPEQQRAALLAGSEEWARLGKAERKTLEERLETIAEQGVAISVGERFFGCADVGVLVGGQGHSVAAALTIAVLIDAGKSADVAHLVEPLREVAEAINRTIGLSAQTD